MKYCITYSEYKTTTLQTLLLHCNGSKKAIQWNVVDNIAARWVLGHHNEGTWPAIYRKYILGAELFFFGMVHYEYAERVKA